MEQDIRKDDVKGLMNNIKETFATKYKYQKWSFGLIILLAAVYLVDDIVDFSTLQNFFREEGVRMLLLVFLLACVFKNSFCFRKISESQSADEILSRYDNSVKGDRILIGVLFLVIIALAIWNDDPNLDSFAVVFVSLFLLIYMFSKINDNGDINRLRELVKQENAKKEPEV